MARCMLAGISTSFTSTAETLTPQGPVASSMIPCRIALIFSRSESSSSRTCCPSTERSVVCAFCEVATMKFSTCTIASCGATMRKYATAFTRTGTLSLVITSCGGMFSVIVRRSTFTIRSTIGISRNRPGPFGSASSRPSRKTIPRSYSRATLIAETRKRITRKSRIATRINAAATGGILLGDRFHDERQLGADTRDAHPLARPERLLTGRLRAPELALHEDQVVAAGLAELADHRLGPNLYRAAAHLYRLRQREHPDQAEDDRERGQERRVHVVVRRRRVVEEQQRADHEADQACDRERTVGDHVRVDHEQPDAEQQQREPGPADRQHREAEEREQQRDRAQRAGQDDARKEDLEADPGDPGEEQQRDQVRVDQRVQQLREEPWADVIDLRVRG